MMQAANSLNGWLALLLAGLLEVAWALGLKYSEGLTRFWPSVTMIAAIALSFGLLAVSLKSVPFGTAYAVWTGIGAVGTVIIGMTAFGEPGRYIPRDMPRLHHRGHGGSEPRLTSLKIATPSPLGELLISAGR